jgi:GT2 family glycosyltransferase
MSKKLILEANKRFKEGNYREALDLYNELIKSQPFFKSHVQANIIISKQKLNINSKNIITQGENKLTKPSRKILNAIGNIDKVDASEISGWIYDKDNPEEPINIDLIINGVKVDSKTSNLKRIDVKNAGHLTEYCGFYFNIFSLSEEYNFLDLELRFEYSDQPILGWKFDLTNIPFQTNSILKACNIIKSKAVLDKDQGLQWVSEYLFQRILNDLRSKKFNFNLPTTLDIGSINSNKDVDVIIPVYKGYEETLNCINSVLTSKNTNKINLIIVNDKSPDNDLTRALKNISREKNITLIENSINLGFVGSVNVGMKHGSLNDVILLNSDTIVPNNWVDQLKKIAYLDKTIGTVTPFSNNATICSYPNFCEDNKLPLNYNCEYLNNIFQEVNQEKFIDIPTAVGFCMYIKRDTLKEVGFFDKEKFGKGYGEENDFSVRAQQKGWRNVFALDTFVQHLGSVSFQSDATNYISKNLEILNKLYPEYLPRISNFIKKDPGRIYREAVTRKLIVQQKRQSFLFVSLTIGGGTDVAASSISELLSQQNINTYYLSMSSNKIWNLSSKELGNIGSYDSQNDFELLISDLKKLSVIHINYQQTMQFDKKVWELPKEMSCNYDVTLHDYFYICPRVNLINESEKYCNEPSSSECDRCIEKNGEHESSYLKLSDFKSSIVNWRNFYQDVLAGARLRIVPSFDAAKRFKRYFPDLSFSVKPHPENIETIYTIVSSKSEKINVAIIGAIGIHKGFNVLIDCAEYITKNKLQIVFHLIGYSSNDELLKEYDCIAIHGKYKKEDLSLILKESNCTIAGIFSVWPETYCYTLSEALYAGMKVLTFDLGAQEARIPKGAGLSININSNAKDIIKALYELANMRQVQFKLGNNYENIIRDYYEFK